MKTYTIKESDINKKGIHTIEIKCDCCNVVTRINPFEPLGRVLKQDVGKICKKINGIWYVENDSQFNKRTSTKQNIK